ncbi:hypothetical protein CBG25_02090 [Arsenophonus sp. ENCA]|uniref:phage tail assembly protein n=1 Tax=Arsenophonus sp. ENCA TaxID=1987579 RepID=UPI000BD7F545|nr:phage tail assembly protein [Arsenophonus sp. ENCA]PAV10390.1 hypothetical protein CBG25_02090 [Arsenophonus sp. ENCA]
MMTDCIHYRLQYPYALGSGERLTQVSLNRLKVSDIKAVRRLSENVNDWDSLLIARMTGLIPEDIDNMDLVDYQQLQGHFRQFAGLDALAEGAASGTGAVGEMVPLAAQ